MFVLYTPGEGQYKTDLPTDTTRSQIKGIVTAYGPNTMVRTIKQDRNGNIWLASSEGIIRYDGKSFTNVTGEVSSARFFSLLEDRKGNFWFSSVGSGVYHYDGKSFQNFTTKEGLVDDKVPFVYEDKAGAIWLGTVGGVSRYDGKSFQNFTTKEGLPDNEVNAIVEDKTGKFWFGTKGKACVYDGKKFTVLTHEGNPFINVRSIIEDKKGNIWLGGNDGLWRYDGRTFTNFTRRFVGYVYEDKKGNIWTGSLRPNNARWALYRYDEKSLSDDKPTATEVKFEHEADQGMVLGILEANDGSIWFGAFPGVRRYDGNTITDFSGKESQK
jgi:ligand-binding sensor domain-containing protein